MSAQFTHLNPITGKAFAELADAPDTAILDEQMHQNRYAYPEWATFQQSKKASPPRFVRRGQKGTQLISGKGFKWYVFNIDQTAHKVEKVEV